jgi:SEC-C motif-containing protein
MNCPCCSGKTYADCCQDYHQYKKFPETAAALMRSRYAAYVLPNGAYLMKTTHPSKQYQHDAVDMEAWGRENTWLKLEIVAAPAANIVEFKAFYIDNTGQEQLHHEISTFKKHNLRWYYYSSKFIQV